jgi:hypothetical protein
MAAPRFDATNVASRFETLCALAGREHEREDNKENGRNYHGADKHCSLELLLSQSLS